MKLINKFLKLFSLTWVTRKRQYLSAKLEHLGCVEKKLLIFAKDTNKEKILLETNYK